MIDPSWPLQQAIFAALSGNVGAAVGARVYDEPPANPTFPYVVIGDCQVLPDKADCIDGVEAYPAVHVWSRTAGYEQTKTITAAVLAALDDQALTVSGFNLTLFEIQSVNYLRDPDGLTRHAALTFHALLDPSA